MRPALVQVDPFGVLLDGHEQHFSSGSNHAGEIRALALSGNNPGVAVPRLNKEAEGELVHWLKASPTLRAFLDTAAFGEMAEGPDGQLILKKEIPLHAWSLIIRAFHRVAAAAPGRVHVVAPDRPGSQEVTLERLELWEPELAALYEAGARLIVPIQRGALSQEQFWLEVCEVLGHEDFIVGIPARKAVGSPEEMAELLRALPPLHPPDVHLLGLGPDSPRYSLFREAAAEACPRATVWSDSVRIKAMVGHARERKDGSVAQARPLTAARMQVLSEGTLREHQVAAVKAAALARALGEAHRRFRAEARAAGWEDLHIEAT